MKTPRKIPARSCCSIARWCLQLFTPVLVCSSNFSAAQDLPSLDAMTGKALFEKSWVSAPASTAASDGLGPFFNARSCAACHQGGGRGTSPEALNFVTADLVYGEFLQTRAVQGLRAEAQIKISTRAQVMLLADGTEVVLHAPVYEPRDLQYGALRQSLSARVAPALAGLHLLEQVPEQYLQALADPDDTNGDGISGRISKVTDPATGTQVTGRFGWKAESYSLRAQVAKALSLDMGLGNSLFPSAYGDCTQHQPDCLRMAPGNSPALTDPEVSDTILELLLTYLHSLAPDQQHEKPVYMPIAAGENLQEDKATTTPANAALAADDELAATSTNIGTSPTGTGLFSSIGCSACHRPSMPAGESRISPFTDLLLHDMGPGLAAGNTESAEAAEWRTAPLWGLGSARSYLHDGRATTLAAAILWHGGEATGAVTAYGQLTTAEREVLHSWLHGL